MRVSIGNPTVSRCFNPANSSLTIDGKFGIINKRIASVREWGFITFNSEPHLVYREAYTGSPNFATTGQLEKDQNNRIKL